MPIPTTKAALADQMKDICCEYLALQPEDITPESRFIEDLNADSLDSVELSLEFEDKLGVEIPDSEMERLLTFQQAVDYIAEKLEIE